jgi:hypothetical protein
MFSSRNLDEVNKLIDGLWPKPPAGTPREAAAFGEVILVPVPYTTLPQIGKNRAAESKATVVHVSSKCRLSPADMAEAANESACSRRRLQRLDRHV